MEIPKPLPGPDLKSILSEWDYNYIMLSSLNDTIDLVNAANFLDIKELVNLSSARLGYEMTNCPIEEARKKFGVQCDMTKEEMDCLNQYTLD